MAVFLWVIHGKQIILYRWLEGSFRFVWWNIFSYVQAALQMAQSVCLSLCLSVCPSVCLSVCHTLSLCFHHRIIMKFSGLITIDRLDVHTKGHGQRSKVNITEVKTPLDSFRTVTTVWIHRWLWNDAQSLKLRRDALLSYKVIRQISRSHGTKYCWFWPKLGVCGR